MGTQRSSLFLLLGAIFSLVLLITFALSATWGNRPFVNEALHSTIEALGGMCAVVMAIFLLQGKSEQDIQNYTPLAIGFLGMGILDGFHAFSRPGNAFILFHSLANLAGGIGAALMWSPGFLRWSKKSNRRRSWTIAACFVLLGVFIAGYDKFLPVMAQNDFFTPAAIAINLAAGVLFIAATVFFLADFFHSRKRESYLFSCLYLLFGLAEFEFPLSAVWNANWWFWHLQRLAAYLVVLYFLFHTFHRIATERRHLIVQLRNALAEVNQLSGLLPICASCKKIRDDDGNWKQVELFISEHSEAEFSHGLCPDCTKKAFTELKVNRNRTGKS